MLALIICAIFAVVGLVVLVKVENLESQFVGLMLLIVGAVGAITGIGCAINAHVNTDLKVYESNMEYESLCQQVEAIQNDYEDVSAVDVIDKVYDWNIQVHKDKYWAKSPWTNWFYNQKVVESLQYIELE